MKTKILKILGAGKKLNAKLTPSRGVLLVIHYLSVNLLGFYFGVMGVVLSTAYILLTLKYPKFLPDDKLAHLYWGLIYALVGLTSGWITEPAIWTLLSVVLIPIFFSVLNEWSDKHNGGHRSIKDHLTTILPGIVIYLITINNF